MTAPKPPPRDDAELIARIAQELRLAAPTPAESARFAARVRERISARAARRRRGWVAGALATAVAAYAAIELLGALRPPLVSTPALVAGAQLASAPLADSWEEQVLYAPEWIERDEGFVDAALLPESYALASALLEP